MAYALSYHDIEELAAERGLKVDHSTINRWVIRYAPQLEEAFRRRRKRPVGVSWRMDETYIKVKGKWVYTRNLSKCVIYAFSFSPCRILKNSQGNEPLLAF